MPIRPRVVIVGSGFGGLNAARTLGGKAVDVTVVDRDNYHGFWPLLYQVATSGLGPDDIARPIRAIYSRYGNVDVRLGQVTGIDLDLRCVEIDDEPALEYDYLILAAGSSSADFGIPGVAEHTFPLKTLPDAVRLRNHVLRAFERADTVLDPEKQENELTIVVVGGGPTGVELSGALSELIAHNLASDFKHLDLHEARIVLVETNDHLLPGFSKVSQTRARETLLTKGIDVRLNTKLIKVAADSVSLEDGTEIGTHTVIWTAGVKANPVAEALAVPKGKGGTIPVEADLSLAAHPEVFVIGDLAAAKDRRGDQLPQLAEVAIQGGRHAARNVLKRIQGRPTRKFHYHNYGIMATIGRRSAVAELPGGIRFGGTLGWLSWLVVHLTFLIGFRNKTVVLFNWAWNYLTWDRASRVIVDDKSEPAHYPDGSSVASKAGAGAGAGVGRAG